MNTNPSASTVKKSLLVSALALAYAPAVVAEKALNQETAQNSEQTMEIIQVRGRASQFYFVEESAMATKTPTNYMDMPQSLQVLSHELISDQAAKQTSDLYRSISGMTQFSYSGVTARGFRQDQVRYDGVQGDPYSGFSIPQLFNIERVEVLKGPTGMLYGAGQPGGLLNYVTKKPKFSRASEIALVTGNEDLFSVYGDITDAINQDADLAYRVGGFYQSKNGFRNNTDEKNTLLSAGLTWLVNDRLDLTVQYDFIDQDLGGHRLRGVPVDDNGNFLTDISYNANEKSDFQRLQANVWQLIANSELSADLTNTTVVRILDNKRNQNYHENRGLADDGRSMVRQFRAQLRENKDWSFTTDFVYQMSLADTEHTWLFGGDYFVGKLHYQSMAGKGEADLIPDLDIINPVYGADPETYLLDAGFASDTEIIRHGIYLQDQIRLNDYWLAIAGVRYDRFEDKDLNSGFSTSDHDYSPRLGVIYQPDDETSIFANLSQGFAPQSLYYQQESDLDDDVIGDLQAETSIQHELGIKNQWLNDSLLTTVTAYHIVKDNVSSWNPADTGINDGHPALVQIGEVTSKGLEIDVVGDLSENWTGTLNYAYNSAKITGGAPGVISNAIGDEFANAPDHTLGAWTRWDIPNIASSFAFGFDYVSKRLSLSGQKVKAYTVWDASWRSEFSGVEMQINLKNLFDKEYATSGFNERNGHFPGEPRSIQVQLSYAL
ncbi:TonB-dependent siderophore receptor [Thalassomonas haliotis]|uniref:TonB-dependent siderophore receptor n=1 Tax=Thalassomonas haliotis TaxID=485448 RepID=A0ABY7V9I5_9GAMM|nr:TonB-dependent siderophore receptor [Thalassomonas haliotis]WDE10278.1 TonB-dependent siderophore receptor [Thalassomonas haliotis]